MRSQMLEFEEGERARGGAKTGGQKQKSRLHFCKRLLLCFCASVFLATAYSW
ncbi:hypothetical protein CFter6_4207 [Collimonas fungivorans]|uniref:Uncharacterized protein n=1 Tax=Collimonas fungivorans TaxID=158899 RepID=A0A127PG90_9BURK|nr:hypothetical protein CFter6_4207 [Collimonas fungivorans]